MYPRLPDAPHAAHWNAARLPARPSAAAALAGAAIGLGAAAAYGHYRCLHAERENPPMGRFVEVDGIRLHYVERGTGQPVVLLHGNWMLMQDFASSGLIDLLAEGHRVIAIERPGFGHSTRPRTRLWTPREQARLLAKAFDRLGVDQPTIVGHSWGTLVAMALGLEQPGSLRSLVLLSGYYYPSVRADVAIQSPLGVPVIGDAWRWTVAPIATRASWPAMTRKLFSPNPVPDHFEQVPVWMVCRPSQLRAIGEEAGLMIPSAAQHSRRYGELALPVFIMAGDCDRLVSTEDQSERLHREVPGSTLRVLPEVGHMIHHVALRQVARFIEDAAKAQRIAPAAAAGHISAHDGGGR